ncbi:MAG: ABC transporter permease [Methanomicrobiales archaeon]|nr:ABC transporter permease [Methanomicrobiales archaeon]
MSRESFVARKEISLILKNRGALATALLFNLVFGGLSVPSALAGDPSGVFIDRLGFLVLLMLGIFMGYIFSGTVFLREKQTGVIETVLCAPLSLRQLWLGKVMGVTVVAYGMTLISAAIIFAGVFFLEPGSLILSGPLLANLFLVVPAFVAVSVGLLGFGQLMLGMRENQLLNMGLIFLLVFLVSGASGLVSPDFRGSWNMVAALFGLASLLILITYWLTRFLDKERVVLTIP